MCHFTYVLIFFAFTKLNNEHPFEKSYFKIIVILRKYLEKTTTLIISIKYCVIMHAFIQVTYFSCQKLEKFSDK